MTHYIPARLNAESNNTHTHTHTHDDSDEVVNPASLPPWTNQIVA